MNLAKALISLALLSAVPFTEIAAQRPITSPVQALGKQVGADGFLASYTQLQAYWRKLAAESDRMVLEEIGKTSYGQTMLMAVISSPENIRNRERYRRTSQRLCRARDSSSQEARKLAKEGKAVVWIDAGMHATESIAAQNILELVYRMNVREDSETLRILDNVILLVTPANPDGMEMIARAYMATNRVGGIPVLYQKYIGHDNNRDYYAVNQPETRNICQILYRRWNPQILYNHHQTAPRGTIIFTPPFRDPFNYNFDPLVVRGIDIVSAHMNHRFASENKPGVISRTGAPYSTWWNGGLRTTAYFHNIIGILTESFGHPNPSQIRQTRSRRLPYGDYPMPIATQTWHARQTIEYLQTANWAIMDYAARYKEELLFNFYQMGRRSIERGSRDHWTVTPRLMQLAAEKGDEVFTDPALRDPRAYVISTKQLDRAAATAFVNKLILCGVEVQRATKSFEIGEHKYEKGSFVVRCDQAFRPHVRDMFEPQWHPDDIGSAGQPVRPYDSSGWTLAMQMGVQVDRYFDAVEGPFEELTKPAAVPSGRSTKGTQGWLFEAGDSHAYIACNRLLSQGIDAYWLSKEQRIDGRTWAAGSIYVPKRKMAAQVIEAVAKDLGLEAHGVNQAPKGKARKLKKPRIGLFDVYGGNMSTGWTQWVLEQFEFPVELVFGKRIVEGDLNKDFDVLIFHTGLPNITSRPMRRRPSRIKTEDIAKLRSALPPFEDWSSIEDRLVHLNRDNSLEQIRSFVKNGGSLIAVGAQASAAIRIFDLPVKAAPNTQRRSSRRSSRGSMGRGRAQGRQNAGAARAREEFFVPGSLVRTVQDRGSFLCYGMPETGVAMFRRSPVWEVELGSSKTSVVSPVRYAKTNTLASGWALGVKFLHDRSAVVQASFGKGKLFLYGPDVTYRGQPWSTFKLVFNAILGGSSTEVARVGK